MLVKIDGKRYKVEFSYKRGYDPTKVNAGGDLIKETEACLLRPGSKRSEWIIFASGISRRAVQDNPCKATGRRVALYRALASVWPCTQVTYNSESGHKVKPAPKHNREMRTKFWKAYFKYVEKAKPGEKELRKKLFGVAR